MRVLFAVLVVIGVVLGADTKTNWWDGAVVYQIYALSFKDSDGDGVGDLKGIIDQLDYVKSLGVDAIWLSPIYESPMRDNGYDVSNYTAINPRLGTMDDFDDLVKKIHKNGMKLIMDFVPNHTSDKHPWFISACNNDAKFKNYYVWLDQKNNWVSVFGGPAWTYNNVTKMYYFHNFGDYQPELNYSNPEVVVEMKSNLKFWMDKGADGFRMDAVPYLIESNYGNEPRSKSPSCANQNPPTWNCLDHIYTVDQNGTYELLSDFKQYLKSYENQTDIFMVVEAYSPIKKTMEYYTFDNKTVSDMPFNFFLVDKLNRASTGSDYKKAVDDWVNNQPEGTVANWLLGNHDKPRIGSVMGRSMIDNLNMLIMSMPGTVFTYYGEEIGMTNTYVLGAYINDTQGRDPERTPFQWNRNKNAGFSSSNTTWLPVNPNYWTINKDSEKGGSHLNFYTQLVSLHKDMKTADKPVTTNFSMKYAYGHSRKKENTTYTVAINLDDNIRILNVSAAFSEMDQEKNYVVLGTPNSGLKKGDVIEWGNLTLPPSSGAILSNKVVSAATFSSIHYSSLILCICCSILKWIYS